MKAFGAVLAVLLSASQMVAQEYQTAFSSVRFDRTKGATTFHSGVEIEAATGAANLNIPFGPGIGARGVFYRPALGMRLSPEFGISSRDEEQLVLRGSQGTDIYAPVTVDTLYQRGFGSSGISPGSIDLHTLASHNAVKKGSISLPNGSGGRIEGSIANQLTPSLATGILREFGFGTEWEVGYEPNATPKLNNPIRPNGPITNFRPYIRQCTNGYLVFAVRKAGSTNALSDEIFDSSLDDETRTTIGWYMPRRIVAVMGNELYEYLYSNHSYVDTYIPNLYKPNDAGLYSAHYVLVSIRNKLGERIKFTYDSDGVGYKAEWLHSEQGTPATTIDVHYLAQVPLSPAQPGLMLNNLMVQNTASKISITYSGTSQPVSSYILEATDPHGLGGVIRNFASTPNDLDRLNQGQRLDEDWNKGAMYMQPIKMTAVATSQSVKFSYSAAFPISWNTMSASPVVLSKIEFPTKVINLAWLSYRFRTNYSPEAWGGIVSGTEPCRPTYGYGVSQVVESDGVQERATSHLRELPTANWNYYNDAQIGAPPEVWVTGTFYDGVIHPDGSATLHKFVEPPLDNATLGEGGMKNLAFMKAVEVETRNYAPGKINTIDDFRAEYSILAPTSSKAYSIIVKDRFSLYSAGGANVVPRATRIRTWDNELSIFTVQEDADWDSLNQGWKVQTKSTSITNAPDLSVQYLGSSSINDYLPVRGVESRLTRVFNSCPEKWLFGRVESEKIKLITDNTGFKSIDIADGIEHPSIKKNYNSSIDRVDSVDFIGTNGAKVTTQFSYLGTSGVDSVSVSNVKVSSSDFSAAGLSGKFGVDSYEYDQNGYMTSIARKPNEATTLTARQSNDELGRPMTQTDFNNITSTIAWDEVGRLKGLDPGNGDFGTTIVYDPDGRGAVITSGNRRSELRYNGYGQLILERRLGESGSWSHKLFGYDVLGRPTGESVWLSGRGEGDESLWASPNLTSTVNIITTEYVQICKRWTFDDEGNAVCAQWQSVPQTTTTTFSAKFDGSSVTYDHRGRVLSTTDANGVKTENFYFGSNTLPPTVTTYIGPVQKAVVGALETKWIEKDSSGRLVRIITPVTRHSDVIKSSDSTRIEYLRTEYYYDGFQKVREARQYDASITLENAQRRFWEYNEMGWLSKIRQPETGDISFSGFAVNGNPTVTTYSDGVSLITTPDMLGRPFTVTSSDGTVSQEFHYDDSTVHGSGLVTQAVDGNVTTSYEYLNNRLKTLTTTVTLGSDHRSVSQEYLYDSYGQRVNESNGHGSWSTSFLPISGLPSGMKYSGSVVLDSPWASYDPISWAPLGVLFGNGVSTAYSYDKDQVRLTGMAHLDKNSLKLNDWSYLYDSAGNLVRQYDKTKPDGTGSYKYDQYNYDELKRLIGAVVQSTNFGEQLQQFDYDAFGNRISSNLLSIQQWNSGVPITTASSAVGNPNRQIVNAKFSEGSSQLLLNRIPQSTIDGKNTGVIYDIRGNLKQIFDSPTSSAANITLDQYDALGRVHHISNSKNGISEQYEYNSDGLRSIIRHYQWGTLSKTTINIYNDTHQLTGIWEIGASNSLVWTRDILYLDNKQVAEFDAIGMRITQVDHVGTPRVVTDVSGSVISRQKFLPFGELIDTSGTFKSAKGYTGHEQTDDSGLIYMQARFYVPWYGKFGSPDPSRDQQYEFTQSWNINSYVRNSPVSNVDPTGLVVGPDGKTIPEDPPASTTPQANPPLPPHLARDGSQYFMGMELSINSISSTQEQQSQKSNTQTGSESVGQLIHRKGLQAAIDGDKAACLGWSMLGAFYEGLTPGGDRLSQVNARAQNDEIVPAKDLAVAGGAAGLQLALTAAPQLGLNGGSNSVFWSGYKQGAQGAAQQLGTTIEKTPVGRVLDRALNSAFAKKFIPGAVKTQIWKAASNMFAANAKGTALAVIRKAGEVWTNIESKVLAARGVTVLPM